MGQTVTYSAKAHTNYMKATSITLIPEISS